MSKRKEREEPSADDVATRVEAIVRDRMERAPYQTLGIAIGIGVVVGGGMWRLLARSLFGLGARRFIATLAPPQEENDSPTFHPEV